MWFYSLGYQPFPPTWSCSKTKIKMLASFDKRLNHILETSYRYTESLTVSYLSRQGIYIQLKQEEKETSTQMQILCTNNRISARSPCCPQQLTHQHF